MLGKSAVKFWHRNKFHGISGKTGRDRQTFIPGATSSELIPIASLNRYFDLGAKDLSSVKALFECLFDGRFTS